MLQFFKIQYNKLYQVNEKTREELIHILENLEEAIISVTADDRIGFCNKLGFQIIHEIAASQGEE